MSLLFFFYILQTFHVSLSLIKKNSKYNVFNRVIIEEEYPMFGRMVMNDNEDKFNFNKK